MPGMPPFLPGGCHGENLRQGMRDAPVSIHNHDTASETDAAPAACLALRPDGPSFICTGAWDVLHLGESEMRLRDALAASGVVETIDITGIARLDTTGALVLQHAAALCAKRGGKGAIVTDNERHRQLLDRVRIPAKIQAPEFTEHHYGIQFLNDLGEEVVSQGRTFAHKLNFLGNYLAVLGLSLLRPASIRWTSLLYHMQQAGVAAVPIVALLTFLVGVVVAYMGTEQLSLFGAEIFVINLVEVTTMREMAPLITAIVVAGRSGSAFTAQIGAMTANEEVAAMRTMGLDPMRVLVLPRVLALILMLPALAFLADIMGLLGGGIATCLSVRMSAATFVARLQEVASLNNLAAGLAKTPFFALAIGAVGCFHGFQATGSAESVGRLTTKAVVESIFLVIVLNAAFAVFFTTIGI